MLAVSVVGGDGGDIVDAEDGPRARPNRARGRHPPAPRPRPPPPPRPAGPARPPGPAPAPPHRDRPPPPLAPALHARRCPTQAPRPLLHRAPLTSAGGPAATGLSGRATLAFPPPMPAFPGAGPGVGGEAATRPPGAAGR